MATATRKVGRPSEYSSETAERICAELAMGKSLRTVLKLPGMPVMSTVFKWLSQQEEFAKQYARAKQESADAMAEEILDISDDGANDYMTVTKGDTDYKVVNNEAIQRSRLRVETRKWLMAKMKPKIYGDKLDMTSGGEKLPTPIIQVPKNT